MLQLGPKIVGREKMIKLSHDLLVLLKKCLDAHRPDLLWILTSKENIYLTEDIGNELRDAVSEELLENGFNDDDEPNKLGLELESLIDKIGDIFMDDHKNEKW